jgi:hypothetical protein
MVGLFGYLAGGALEGYGKAMQENAIAMRNEAFREAEAQRNHLRLLERDRIDREATAAESEKSRAFMAAENEKGRQPRSTIVGEDGTLMDIAGSKATQITDQNGNPVKGNRLGGSSGGSGTSVFDRKLALALEITGGDKEKAFNMASGKTAGLAERERIANQFADRVTPKDPFGNRDSKQYEENLARARKQLSDLFDDGEDQKSSRQRIEEIDEKALKAEYPDAYKGADGQWYVKRGGKEMRIRQSGE